MNVYIDLVTVVRDPIERILSAYKDKAFEEFRGKAGSKVIHIVTQGSRADCNIRCTIIWKIEI